MQRENEAIHENSFSIEFEEWTTLSSMVSKAGRRFAGSLMRRH